MRLQGNEADPYADRNNIDQDSKQAYGFIAQPRSGKYICQKQNHGNFIQFRRLELDSEIQPAFCIVMRRSDQLDQHQQRDAEAEERNGKTRQHLIIDHAYDQHCHDAKNCKHQLLFKDRIRIRLSIQGIGGCRACAENHHRTEAQQHDDRKQEPEVRLIIANTFPNPPLDLFQRPVIFFLRFVMQAHADPSTIQCSAYTEICQYAAKQRKNPKYCYDFPLAPSAKFKMMMNGRHAKQAFSFRYFKK